MNATLRTRSGVPAARRARHAITVAALASCALMTGMPAHAAGASAPRGSWLSVGILGGTAFLDPQLAHYQWDTRPALSWGAIAQAGRGAVAIGARITRSETTQRLDVAATPTSSPAVLTTTYEVFTRARVASVFGVDATAGVSAGRLRMTWRPGHVVLEPAGGSGVDVLFAPVEEWTGGAGVTLDRAITRGWAAGVSVERQFNGLDTAHRNGAGIVYQRESFGTWNARFELSRVFHLHERGTTR